ncbi:MAG: hypothetical protein Fur0042_09340 [Cyanophyceae cyanobacterium]
MAGRSRSRGTNLGRWGLWLALAIAVHGAVLWGVMAIAGRGRPGGAIASAVPVTLIDGPVGTGNGQGSPGAGSVSVGGSPGVKTPPQKGNGNNGTRANNGATVPVPEAAPLAPELANGNGTRVNRSARPSGNAPGALRPRSQGQNPTQPQTPPSPNPPQPQNPEPEEPAGTGTGTGTGDRGPTAGNPGNPGNSGGSGNSGDGSGTGTGGTPGNGDGGPAGNGGETLVGGRLLLEGATPTQPLMGDVTPSDRIEAWPVVAAATVTDPALQLPASAIALGIITCRIAVLPDGTVPIAGIAITAPDNLDGAIVDGVKRLVSQLTFSPARADTGQLLAVNLEIRVRLSALD